VVEAVTYRLSDHTTADDASRYRPQAELDAAWQREPLLRTRRFMEQRGFWDEAREAALRADCAAQIEAAVHGYQNRPAASTDHMFDHLFANPPAALEEQKLIARRYGKTGSH
jgi:pyruvate dehydrogenase E1 component alpha subunit